MYIRTCIYIYNETCVCIYIYTYIHTLYLDHADGPHFRVDDAQNDVHLTMCAYQRNI